MVTDKAPVNIYKSGKDPELKPDGEYPAWLWRLLDPLPTLDELKAKPELTFQEMRRLVRLERRRLIKQHNENSKTG
jgi:large subunit ribosomal protein L54